MTRITPLLFASALVFSTGCQPDDPAVVEPEAAETVVDVAVQVGLTTFVDLLDAAGMLDDLAQNGPFTLFAPSDEAFAAVDPATLDALRSPENRDALSDLLGYHVVEDSLRMAFFEGEHEVATLQGEPLTIIANDDITLTDAVGEIATVQPVEHEADNGIVYVIDQVLFHTLPADLVADADGDSDLDDTGDDPEMNDRDTGMEPDLDGDE